MSIDGFGSGVSVPVSSRSYCMNTRFQNSRKRSPCSSTAGPPSGPNVGPAVEVDLAARSARPGLAGLPEVLLVAEPLDPLHRHTDDVVPDLLGDVVGLVDGDPQAVTVHPPRLGDQLPARRDDELLEVVAEAEVAEHLEEHEVALGAADVVEVVVLAARPHALLRADRPLVRRPLVAEEVGLERHHPGDVEQQRRVLRHEARRRHRGVVARDEEVDERLTDVVGAARMARPSRTSVRTPARGDRWVFWPPLHATKGCQCDGTVLLAPFGRGRDTLVLNSTP